MTALADVALAFCRECLGWPSDKCYIVNAKIWAPPGKANFDPTDLNAVMAEVLGWLAEGEQEDLGLVLRFTRRREVVAIIQDEAFWPANIIAEIESDDPHHALLSACVEASRQLKGAV